MVELIQNVNTDLQELQPSISDSHEYMQTRFYNEGVHISLWTMCLYDYILLMYSSITQTKYRVFSL